MPETITSRQWQSRLDGISNLTLGTKHIPLPGPSEILVKIKTVSLNYKDGETIEGLFTHHASVHLDRVTIPCADAAGQVHLLGSSVTKWKTGDRVLSVSYPAYRTGAITPEILASGIGSTGRGVLCEYRLFHEDAVVALPEYLSDEEACTLQTAGTTAWVSLNWLRPIGSISERSHEGEVVLLQGTGGVSIHGLLVAKASGATVIMTSSSDEKLARAKELGADYGINYRETLDWEEKVLEITEGVGADIIFENGGALTTAKSLKCVKMGGVINGIGYVTGKVDRLANEEERTNINVSLIKKACIYKGLLNGPRDRFEEMLAFYEKHQIRLSPIVDKVYEFEDAKEAFAFLWRGGHFGKVVIKVSD